MKEKSQVRFVRIRGRIVPVKVKSGSGSRGGRLKAQRNRKQTVGQRLADVGVLGLSAGLLNKTGHIKLPKSVSRKGLFKYGGSLILGGALLKKLGNNQRGDETRALNAKRKIKR